MGGATSFAAKSVSLIAAPSAGDSDGDGLLDAYEIAAGLDPNNPDSDGNGILDGDELVSGGDMTQSQAQQIWLATQNSNAAALPFTITKLSGKASVSKPGKDSVSASLAFSETLTLGKARWFRSTSPTRRRRSHSIRMDAREAILAR